jgi:hypothetical protein
VPLSISLESVSKEKLTFVVNGPEGVFGSILLVRFGAGTLKDMKNITVIYDN